MNSPFSDFIVEFYLPFLKGKMIIALVVVLSIDLIFVFYLLSFQTPFLFANLFVCCKIK